MFLRKAMRYYRLWIYTCNAVLFAAVVVLVAVAAHTASHPYFPLLPGPPAYDPTLIYAYTALLLQAGVIQTLGCLGALRLSQKLLNMYWLMLVALLLGDIIVGFIWLVRFPKLSEQINVTMNSTIHNYGYDETSSGAWNSLQVAERCCGVRSSDDYSSTKWGIQVGVVPSSCCVPRGASSVQADQAARHVPKHVILRSERPPRLKNFSCARTDFKPYHRGCEEALKNWMHSAAESLMILGFCVLTFIKLCFVGILKFEIQEMIEKIKVLQGESSNTPDPELAAALGLVLPGPQQGDSEPLGSEEEDRDDTQLKRENKTEENHIRRESCKEGGGGGGGQGLPGNSIIINEEKEEQDDDDAESIVSHVPPIRSNIFQNTQDYGGDSDTNSHSALITDTPVHNPVPLLDKTRHNGNNNEVTSVPLKTFFHVRQTQI